MGVPTVSVCVVRPPESSSQRSRFGVNMELPPLWIRYWPLTPGSRRQRESTGAYNLVEATVFGIHSARRGDDADLAR